MRKTLLVALLLTACSQRGGFHQESLRAGLEAAPQVTDEAIHQEFSRRAQLPQKFRLGVYFRDPIAGNVSGDGLWRWKPEEKEILASLQIPDATIFPISLTDVEGQEAATRGGLHDWRLAAAKRRADALLVVSAAQESYWSANPLSLTYLLVLPAFFVKGNDLETFVVTRASLWDVRNEFLYLSAEAEAERIVSRPLTSTHEKEILLATRKDAVGRLRDELTHQWGALVMAER